MCNDTNKLWLISDIETRKADDELANINGITSTGPQLLTLVITQSANDTLYGCGIIMMGDFVTDTGVVYVASTYACTSTYMYFIYNVNTITHTHMYTHGY